MSSLTIRKLDPAVKEKLRERAALRGRSMEAEACHILEDAAGAASRPLQGNLCERIRRRFDPLGGVDLELPQRGPAREPPRFE
jgi:plasmid stability protein